MMMEARDWIYSRKGPQVKECRWLLEAEKGKEIDSPLEIPEKITFC